nr:hypothetical protein [Tanacetum cinerariifolium]
MSSFYQRECFGCGQPCKGHHCYSCTCSKCGIILYDGICINCAYGDEKPVTCDVCEGPLMGGFCLFCDSRAKNPYTYDQNAYYFNNTSRNFTHLPQPKFENYLCNLCGNNSHYGYDCQPQFLFVYKQELSNNQNYNVSTNGQNNDSSSLDQIQSPQYLEIHHPSQADVEEVLQDREKFIQDTQTFLEKFNRFSFGFTLRVLTIAWERIDKIKYVLTKPEEISELMYKLREDVRNIREELAEYIDSLIWNCPTFFYDDDEVYTIQYREYLEKPPDAVTTILPTEEPEHSLSMGYEHLSITPETESEEVTESNAENLLPIPSKCEVTLEDEIECDMLANDDCSPVSTTFSNPIFKDDDDLDSSDDESLPEEDVPAEEFKIYSNHLFDEDEINSDKLDLHCFNVEYDFVESLLNRDTFIDFSSELAHIKPKIPKSDFDFEEEIRLIENLHYDNSFPRPLEELNVEIADTIIESIPLLPIPVQDGNSQQEEIDIVTKTDDVLPPSDDNDDDLSNDFLLGEADLFLSDNSIPLGIENVADDPEGDIRFLEELLINDSILSHELSDSNFKDNPSISRPPPEPPDVESFFDLKPDVIAEKILDKLNEDKCFEPGREINVSTKIEDDDYFPFMFVIRFFLPYFILPEISPLFLSAESEDTIFDPGLSLGD